jgi:hypothetical protein
MKVSPRTANRQMGWLGPSEIEGCTYAEFDSGCFNEAGHRDAQNQRNIMDEAGRRFR